MTNELGDIIKQITNELKRAKKKFPSWPDHPAAQAGIVCEEAGELMRECLHWKYERPSDEEKQREIISNMKKEAIQTAVTAIRFLENLKPFNSITTNKNSNEQNQNLTSEAGEGKEG